MGPLKFFKKNLYKKELVIIENKNKNLPRFLNSIIDNTHGYDISFKSYLLKIEFLNLVNLKNIE